MKFDRSTRCYVSHVLLPLFMLLGGCSSQNVPPRFPVRGQVLWNGKPLPEARVVFHPASPHENLPSPFAETDAQGQFQLTTLEPGDGALPGDYKITVEQRALVLIGEEEVRDGRQLLPTRYGNPETSGLIYTVQSTENLVPPFELKDR